MFSICSHVYYGTGNGGNGADISRNSSFRGPPLGKLSCPYFSLSHDCFTVGSDPLKADKQYCPMDNQEGFWNRDMFYSKIALTRSVPRVSVQVLKKNSCTLQNFLRSFGPS